MQESPFRGTLDWRRFFAAPTHEEALARLHFLVDEARPLGLLLGPAGSGKSLVLEVFARRLLRAGAQVANLNLSGLDLHEFLWLIAAELGINPDRREDSFRIWRGILDRLTENRYQQLSTILLLDDVDEAAPTVLDHVARLTQINNTPRGRLSIVLSASTSALRRLTPRLIELAELRVDLEPWEPTDTVQYVRGALVQAGADAPVFSDEALERLHDLSGGIPRRVNRLANFALLAGAGRELNEIDVDTVEGAHLELDVASAVA
ncbi:MAG TPA: AAA family ATPase [Pirellulales bacterium]